MLRLSRWYAVFKAPLFLLFKVIVNGEYLSNKRNTNPVFGEKVVLTETFEPWTSWSSSASSVVSLLSVDHFSVKVKAPPATGLYLLSIDPSIEPDSNEDDPLVVNAFKTMTSSFAKHLQGDS